MTSGLDDVIAAETVLSEVDGLGGHLTIRGYALRDLAGHRDFAGAVHLLFDGFFADLPDAKELAARLGQARVEVFERIAPLLPTLAKLDVYDGMRAGTALMPDGATLDDALRLVAAPAVLTPALLRLRQGKTTVAPDAKASHAADMLRMLAGKPAKPELAAALDAYLVTVCDHGMNASTFTTRVIASTQADLFAAITGGYCALTGPLHGGAPEPVLEMLDAIGTRERIQPWVDGALAHGERLMGFGHRVYRVRDPRADVLKVAIERLEASGADLPFAGEVEAYIRQALRKKNPERPLETNVEFFTAILLDGLAIPRQAFTPIFAVARAAGWTAHALEQRRTGRLIRPSSSYVGAVPKG